MSLISYCILSIYHCYLSDYIYFWQDANGKCFYNIQCITIQKCYWINLGHHINITLTHYDIDNWLNSNLNMYKKTTIHQLFELN